MSASRRSALSIAAPIGLCALASAQGTLPDFPVRVWPTGVTVGDLAVGDFDGDGDSDAAVSAFPGLVVLWCDGQLNYDTTSLLDSTRDLYSLGCADLNGDGFDDLVACDAPSRELCAWLSDGVGGFVAQPPVAGALLTSFYLSTGDVDGDGNADVVWSSNFVEVFRGDGTGGFAAPVSTAIFINSTAITLDDWNGDGLDDVAVGLQAVSPSAKVLLSDGAGGFSTSTTLTLSEGARSVAGIDCNADGLRDLACGLTVSQQKLAVLLGDGAGGFAPAVYSTEAGGPDSLCALDLNGDGVEELLSNDQSRATTEILEHVGGGKYASMASAGGTRFSGRVEVGDADGDGDLDAIVLGTSSDAISVAENLGFSSFDVPRTQNLSSTFVKDLAVGDLDGDGLDEIVGTAWHAHALAVIRPLQGGGFVGPTLYTTAAKPLALELGDLEGDGFLDAVSVHDVTSQLTVMKGDGTGALRNPDIQALAGPGADVTLGDFNGDQELDAAVAVSSPALVQMFLGDGAGGLSPSSSVATVNGPVVIRSSDVDGDGNLDVLVGGGTPSPLRLHLGDGLGGLGSAIDLAADALDVSDVVLADVDGNGTEDVVIAYAYDGPGKVLFADGGGTFSTQAHIAAEANPDRLAARDFDQDGDDDLVMLHRSTQTYAIVLGDPSGSLTENGRFAISVLNASSLALGHFDADGALDVVMGSESYLDNGFSISLQAASIGQPTLYCTAKLNSLACTPVLGYAGVPSASAGSGFTISAQDVLNQKIGLFFYSIAGPNAVPFLGGTYCVKPPTQRTALQSSLGNSPPSDCSGSYSIDFNAQIALGADPTLVPGQTVFGQFWSRDPGFAPPNNVGFTAAIRATIGP